MINYPVRRRRRDRSCHIIREELVPPTALRAVDGAVVANEMDGAGK